MASSTPGTVTEVDFITSDDANYILAITERLLDAPQNIDGIDAVTEYGIVYADTATASFTIGQFYDDKNRTQFRTVLARLQPQEVCSLAIVKLHSHLLIEQRTTTLP
jgi:DNA mismatch repair ATPase MutS